MVREVCFDTETTGLDPLAGDRLLEIGCVELIDGKRTGKYFHEIINPERDIPEDVVRIHGISNDKVVGKPTFKEIVDDLIAFIGDSTLVAHNAPFDMKFLNNEFDLLNIPRLKNEVVDSLLLAKQKFPGVKNNLDALCERFKIDNSSRTFHGALLDAELLADVYVELNGGLQKSFIEDKKKNTDNGGDFSLFLANIKNNKIIESRHFTIKEEDSIKHDEFLEKYIKDSIWNNDKC